MSCGPGLWRRCRCSLSRSFPPARRRISMTSSPRTPCRRRARRQGRRHHGGVYTYFEITSDLRRCASPMCGGFFMKRREPLDHGLRRTGSTAAQCYTPDLDWVSRGSCAASRTSSSARPAALSAAGTRSSVAGSRRRTRPRRARSLGRFVVTEAWVAEGDDAPARRVRQGHAERHPLHRGAVPDARPRRGSTARAAGQHRRPRLGPGRRLHDRQVEGFVDQYTAHRAASSSRAIATRSEIGRSGKGRTVTNAFHSLANAPGECSVGGCSDQVCSDQDGVTRPASPPRVRVLHDGDLRAPARPVRAAGRRPPSSTSASETRPLVPLEQDLAGRLLGLEEVVRRGDLGGAGTPCRRAARAPSAATVAIDAVRRAIHAGRAGRAAR